MSVSRFRVAMFFCVLLLIGAGCVGKSLINAPYAPLAASWYMPRPGVSWQWQLSGLLKTSYKVDVYDIDLVDAPQRVIDDLHGRGIQVICYFSAGTLETFRPDAGDIEKQVVGKPLEDWPDERWLDVTHVKEFEHVMLARLDLAKEKKCDGVEPDNVDAYQNDSGFRISYDDQLAYNRWLADEAHKRGLAVALKNDLDQVKDLVDWFDFAINEQCFQYDECDALQPFIDAQKAVLGVEYELKPSKFCLDANRRGFSWLKMEYELDGGRIPCVE